MRNAGKETTFTMCVFPRGSDTVCASGCVIETYVARIPTCLSFQDSSPSHFLVKTIFQVLVIGLSKSLKRAETVAHGVVFIGLLFLFFVFEVIKDRFNYARIAHWHRMSLLAVLWLSVLALISQSAC